MHSEIYANPESLSTTSSSTSSTSPFHILLASSTPADYRLTMLDSRYTKRPLIEYTDLPVTEAITNLLPMPLPFPCSVLATTRHEADCHVYYLDSQWSVSHRHQVLSPCFQGQEYPPLVGVGVSMDMARLQLWRQGFDGSVYREIYGDPGDSAANQDVSSVCWEDSKDLDMDVNVEDSPDPDGDSLHDFLAKRDVAVPGMIYGLGGLDTRTIYPPSALSHEMDNPFVRALNLQNIWECMYVCVYCSFEVTC